MKTNYTVLSQIEVEGELHKPGATVSLAPEQAEYLLAKAAVAKAPAAAPAPATRVQRPGAAEAA